MSNGIRTFDGKYGYDISVPHLLTEFNSNLIIEVEEEKVSNKNLKNLFEKWKVHQDFENLLYYFMNAKVLFLKPNKIDGTSLYQYYVENKMYEVDKETWKYDEKFIREKAEWRFDSFLTSKKITMVVIAAPFGIGKS